MNIYILITILLVIIISLMMIKSFVVIPQNLEITNPKHTEEQVETFVDYCC